MKQEANFLKCSHTFFCLLWLLVENAVRLPCEPCKASQRQKLMLTSCGHPPCPNPFSITYFPSSERVIPAWCLLQSLARGLGAAIPAPLPRVLASQETRLKGRFEVPPHDTPPLLLIMPPAGTEVSISFLIDGTPDSSFLVIPAGRLWCIKELQQLRLQRPMVFNHSLHTPSWVWVFLTLFFLMFYLV